MRKIDIIFYFIITILLSSQVILFTIYCNNQAIYKSESESIIKKEKQEQQKEEKQKEDQKEIKSKHNTNNDYPIYVPTGNGAGLFL